MEPADRLSLLWVWASISAASWMVPIAGSQRWSSTTPLPAPRLSLSPPYSIFAPGEKVQLTCSPPERLRAEEFRFYKLEPGGRWGLPLPQREGTWELEVSTAHLEPNSTFVCAYIGRDSAGELLQSAQSNPCLVSVVELPPAALSLDPKYPVYLQGEMVTLTCSAPVGRQVLGYLFYKEQQDRTLGELPNEGRGPCVAFRVGQSTAGKYSCAYWIQHSGQGIRSLYSGPVSVAVTELPPAALSLDPKYPMYLQGEEVTLTCSAPVGLQVSGYLFYKEQEDRTLRVLPNAGRGPYVTFRVGRSTAGKYSCAYQILLSGREIQSPHSSPNSVAMTELPPAALSLDPKYPVYLQGEEVTLTCSAPMGLQVSGYLFYKEQQDRTFRELPNEGRGPYEAFNVGQSTAGKYSCAYQIQLSGREIQSPHSGPVSVAMTELPPAALSLDPKYPVYLQGEKVTLTCSTPVGRQVAGYLFYKEPHYRTLEELPNAGRGPYEAFDVNRNTAGKYSCVYWIQLSGWQIQSPYSIPVSVAVTERPPPPLFSVSPKQEVYRSGEFVSLMCLAPDRHRVSKITFLKDSRRLHVTQDNFTHAFCLLPQDGGRYSCKYQAVESEREIPSLTSNVISISVMAGSVPEPPTAVLPAHTYETTAGVNGSPGAPISPALQLTSSQLAAEENSHSAEPDAPVTYMPRSSQPALHDSISSSTDSQVSTKPLDSQVSTKPLDSRVSTKSLDSQGSTKPLDSQGTRTTFTSSSDPRSTSQRRTVSESDNGNGETLDLHLVAGCSAAGVLFLVVLLVCLFRRKWKGNSKRWPRSFWETAGHQQSRMMSQINHPSGTQLDLQEMAKPQEVDADWGILPKPKADSSKHGGPSKQSEVDDDADSGAGFEFPVIDPTYALLSYPCSTFFQAESSFPAKDTHIYEEPL